MSFRSADDDPGQATPDAPRERQSLIDQHSSIDGTVTTTRNLHVEGKAHGTVECQGTLFVAEGADIDASVEAADIVVAGALRGTITCRGRLEIRATGVVRGQVNTERLVIHEGGVYEGHLSMTPSGAANPTPEPVPPVAEPEAANEPPAATSRPSGGTTGYSFRRRVQQPQPPEAEDHRDQAIEDEEEPA